MLVIAASLDFEFVTFVSPRPQGPGSLEAEAHGQQQVKFGSPLPLPRASLQGMGVSLPITAPRCSPFSSATGAHEAEAQLGLEDVECQSPADKVSDSSLASTVCGR